MTDNLRIWNIANKTDPTHTREAKPWGKTITTIDSYYQILRATEAFGPLGQGWGYVLEHEVIQIGGRACALVKLQLWYVDPVSGERASSGSVVELNMLESKEGRPDEEAFKKATTGAMTKALSYLGFSADIFMGKFDDQKYVAQRKIEAARERDAKAKAPLPEVLVKAVADLKGIKDEPALTAHWKKHVPDLKLIDDAQYAYVELEFKKRKAEILPENPAPGEGMDDSRQDHGA